ncbi:MAG: 4-alpha-glucanotransferase, partial [Candidatus Electrothrix sp. AR4]|nr:4-alpha-glucanotransferase [Candidatus Electrothrix sp. AR4]
MHLSSLPGEYGIGDLGSGSRKFIDFLTKSGQGYWQILPLGPTNDVFGNSPYMSSSACAGNPLFISPEQLIEDGWLRAEALPPYNFSEYTVEFAEVTAWKKEIIKTSWQCFQERTSPEELDIFFEKFIADRPWVKEYSLFMALKEHFGQTGWFQWPKALRLYQPHGIRGAEKEFHEEIRYFQFEQYLFFTQWKKLHAYAAAKGVQLIGDLPIYVGLDSADVWANQDIFVLSPETGEPSYLAGVPPDYFSETGQLWGNPLYRWNSRHASVQKNLHTWWAQRLQTILSTVDLIRIDHFRGFEAYWSIPAKEKTAVKGTWKKGPGIAFFQEMKKRLGTLPVIAEDLGVITPEVEKLRDDLGFPGMKILLFAFDGNPDNAYLPHNMTRNCVVYTGTHDNDTTVGWHLSPEVDENAKQQAKRYANCTEVDTSNFHRQLIHLAQSSVAGLCILPMQDALGFGNDCRMNTPGTPRNNWQWRCASRIYPAVHAIPSRRAQSIPRHPPG